MLFRSYGRAFRAPSLYESTYPVDGGKVGSERLDMAELIWMQRLGKSALLTSSLYQYNVNGLVDAVGDSSLELRFSNLGKVQAQGMEATVDVRPASYLRGYFNFSMGRAVDDDTGNLLTNSPSQLLKLGLAAEVTRWASAATELRYESGRRTVAGTRTDPFLIANLNLGIRPFGPPGPTAGRRLPDGFDVAFRVTNLFNAKYAYPGGTEHVQTGITQDGRGLAVRVGYEF